MKDGAAPRNNTKDLLRPQAVDALGNECRGNEEVSKTQTHNFTWKLIGTYIRGILLTRCPGMLYAMNDQPFDHFASYITAPTTIRCMVNDLI